MPRSEEVADAGHLLARFGIFEFDRANGGELRRNGTRLRLQEQPSRLLAALLERAGEVVEREELRRHLWPAETFVDFDHSLNTAVRKLRAALDDSADSPRWIETVARHGYRFMAPVEWVGRTTREASPARAAASLPAAWRRILAISGALLLALSVGVTLVYVVRPRAAVRRLPAIAVLPFDNPDPRTAHLSDGLTELVINSLAGIRDLRVMARTTVFEYGRKPLDPRRAGRELDVPGVIAGRLRLSGNLIRIHVELIDARDGAQMWGRQYEGPRTAMAALQQQLVEDLVQQLRPDLRAADRPRLHRAVSNSADAYELYLSGLHAWNRRMPENLNNAIGYFQRATEVDPDFALAWAGLASAYGVLVGNGHLPAKTTQPRVFAYLEKALSLDPDLAEALTTRAAAKHQYHRDFAGAERDFQRAIELNPSYATAHAWYGALLWDLGREDESWRHVQVAHELDPLSPAMNWTVCWNYNAQRRYEEALEFSRKAGSLDPRFALRACVAASLEGLGRYEEAIAKRTEPGAPLAAHAAAFREAFRRKGWKGVVEKRIEIAKERARNGHYVSPMIFATLYAQAGNADEAFRWLDVALEERVSDTATFRSDPAWDPVRSDPRFRAYARRLGLPGT